jgi:hypothetical protein
MGHDAGKYIRFTVIRLAKIQQPLGLDRIYEKRPRTDKANADASLNPEATK